MPRNDLRQISLALLVSTDFHVPLFHETYEGNRPDAVEFRGALSKPRQRQEEFTENCQDITLVFDKGNNSADGFETLTEQISKARGKLDGLQRRLARHRNGKSKGKRPTLAGTKNQVKTILKARHLTDALDVRVFEKEGHVGVTYRVNRRGIDRLCSTLFGKTILFMPFAASWP